MDGPWVKVRETKALIYMVGITETWFMRETGYTYKVSASAISSDCYLLMNILPTVCPISILWNVLSQLKVNAKYKILFWSSSWF